MSGEKPAEVTEGPQADIETPKETGLESGSNDQKKTELSQPKVGAVADVEREAAEEQADVALAKLDSPSGNAVIDNNKSTNDGTDTKDPKDTENGFVDEVTMYYDQLKQAKVSTISALASTLLFAVSKGWDGIKKFFNDLFSGEDEEDKDKKDDKNPKNDDEEGNEEIAMSDVEKQVLNKFLSVFTEHPDWLTWAYEASQKYGVGEKIVPIVFAIIKNENDKFDPSAKNQDGSNALGLGQFMPSTWESFLQDSKNSEFAGKERSDPKASIFATTWYAACNMSKLGISLSDENAGYALYTAHHDGPGGANKGNGIVPGTYKKRFGEDYNAYRKFVGDVSSCVKRDAKICAKAISVFKINKPNS